MEGRMRRLLFATFAIAVLLPSLAEAQAINIVGVKREDTATANSDFLFPVGAKRCDTAAASSGTDGDLQYFCADNAGRLWVSAVIADSSGNLATIDSGQLRVLANINNGSAKTGRNNAVMEGCVEPDVSVTPCQPVQIGGYASATAPTDVTADGDMARAWFLRNGAQVFTLSSAGTLIAGDASGLEIQGGVAHDAAAAGNPVLMGGYASATAPSNVTGADAVRAWHMLNGAQAVELTAAGTILTGDASGLETQGGVAHDAADAGNPTSAGATAETALSGATLVADGDRTKLYAGIDGVLIVREHANLEDRVSNVVGVTDGSSTSLVAAQGAGVRFCATTLVVSNSSGTNVTVDIRDGTAGSVLMTIPAAANMGGGVVPLPIPLCTTANTAMAQDPSAAASTVTVTAIGFKTKL